MKTIRQPRNSKPLGAGVACDRIVALRATRAERGAEILKAAELAFREGEVSTEARILERVPSDERPRVLLMVDAIIGGMTTR